MTIILEEIPSKLTEKLVAQKEDLLFTGTIQGREPYHKALNFKTLISVEFDSWELVKSQFHLNFKFFNNLLLKIHYYRKKQLSANARFNILKFLAIGYINSYDVRYFNEFLWFYRKSEKYQKFKAVIYFSFKQNLDNQRIHTNPIIQKEKVQDYINKINKKNSNLPKLQKDLNPKLGLLGIPFVLKDVYLELTQKGYSVSVYLIPYFTEIKRRLFLKSGIIFKLYSWLKGVNFPYKVLNYNVSDDTLYTILKKDKLNIGFFKLGFIVKENIFSAFDVGLLHDHLAVLPFVRGRSSIEFSILTGIPAGTTVHFIGKGIDTGRLVKIYTYDINSNSTIKSIRKKIKDDFAYRIVDSMQIVSNEKHQKTINETSKGLTYYSMHPVLSKFIEKYILK